jgi:hypothetical protein
MNEVIRLTREIHNFVRFHLSWEESLRLLEEIVESEEWVQHLEIDLQLYVMARENQGLERNNSPTPDFLSSVAFRLCKANRHSHTPIQISYSLE